MASSKLKKVGAALLCGSLLMSLAACGATGSTTGTPTPSASSPSASASATPTEAAGPVDLLEKYTPEINLTAWRFLNSGIQFEPGDSIEDNVWTRAYKDDLGINLSYVWTVPQEQFDQKLNISVASGDLPDIMWLTNKQLIELTENDMLYDLTDLFQTNTSELTRSILQQDQASFDTAKVGGKLMAIPHTGSAIDSLQILYIRADWLKNLNLEVPKTMQELLAVAEAFTKNDPDQNSKNDTFGMALTKSFIKDNHAGATGFVAGFHGYLRRCVEDSSGNLVYGSIQPEVKAALQQLQDMYKNGLLDQEFGVKDRTKVTESIASGKVGITYGGMSSPGAFLKDNAINDPNADWIALPLLSIDSDAAAPIAKMPVDRYYAVSKDSKNPEAIMKLLEFSARGYSDDEETAEDASEFGITESGIAAFQYALINFEPARKNLNAHINILDAIAKNDTSALSSEEMGYYEKIVAYQNGDRTQWGEAHIFGSPGSFDIINEYVEKSSYIYNEFYGSMTPTMVEKNATLEAMEEEVFTKIIMGQSVDTFDKFVQDWNNLGGEQMTKEVNEWAAARK